MTTTAKGRRNKEILIVALQICHQGRAVVFWMTAILPDILPYSCIYLHYCFCSMAATKCLRRVKSFEFYELK